MRLLVRALGDRTAAFLARIGWTGDAAAIDRIRAPMRAAGVDNHVLALDVAAGCVSPRLGLELSRPGRTAGAWRPALRMMAHRGWCLPEQAAALGRAIRSERIFSPAGVSELHCGINHVKLAVRDRGGEHRGSAKGYVGCVLRPLS